MVTVKVEMPDKVRMNAPVTPDGKITVGKEFADEDIMVVVKRKALATDTD